MDRTTPGGTSNGLPFTVNAAPAATTVSISGSAPYCGSATITASGGAGGTIYYQGTTSGGAVP